MTTTITDPGAGGKITDTWTNGVSTELNRRIPSSAAVATSQSTASASYTDLATVGPAVSVTTTDTALVIITAQITGSSSSNPAFMAFAVSGASTVAAADGQSVMSTFSTAMTVGAAYLVTGLTAGVNTFTAKYRVAAGTGGTWVNRTITVIPY